MNTHTQFKTDHETLRSLMRVPEKSPQYYTFLYVLVSHMRGKLHMETYKGLRGGWRSTWNLPPAAAFPTTRSRRKWQSCYGEPELYYAASKITSLAEQAEWIARFRKLFSQEVDILLVDRVLAGYIFVSAPVAQVAERSA